jgi:hypothetical protein
MTKGAPHHRELRGSPWRYRGEDLAIGLLLLHPGVLEGRLIAPGQLFEIHPGVSVLQPDADVFRQMLAAVNP